MTISEKIIHTSPFEVKLYLEGVFWVAYEQSAYYFMLKKGYKTVKKHIKLLDKDVASLGFPRKVLEDFLKTEAGISTQTIQDNCCVICLKEPVDGILFEDWKKDLPLYKPEVKACEEVTVAVLPQAERRVINLLKVFSIANSTPMECMNFISEIQKELKMENCFTNCG
jgi:hypothetical protein